jgi:hypothetical protein
VVRKAGLTMMCISMFAVCFSAEKDKGPGPYHTFFESLPEPQEGKISWVDMYKAHEAHNTYMAQKISRTNKKSSQNALTKKIQALKIDSAQSATAVPAPR